MFAHERGTRVFLAVFLKCYAALRKKVYVVHARFSAKVFAACGFAHVGPHIPVHAIHVCMLCNYIALPPSTLTPCLVAVLRGIRS